MRRTNVVGGQYIEDLAFDDVNVDGQLDTLMKDIKLKTKDTKNTKS